MFLPSRGEQTGDELRSALNNYVASVHDVRRAALDSVSRSMAPDLPSEYPPADVAHACIVAAQQAVTVARGKKQ